MGLYDRDYSRYSSERRAGGFGAPGGAWPPVCKALLAINITVFLLQLFTTPPSGFSSVVQHWLSLDADKLMVGQVWRLVTYAFCHSTSYMLHIAFNMFLLVMFGRELERMYGSAEFLGFYLVAGVVSGLAFLALNAATGISGAAIGASGAVLGVVVLYAIHFPRQEVRIWFVLPVQIRWLVLVIVLGDLIPALQMLGGQDPNTGVAHAAHLGGIAFAFIYNRSGLRLAPFINKISATRPKTRTSGGKKSKAKLPDLNATGSKAEIQQQVDELLQKISDKGFQSLSDREKRFLEKASSKFGDR